LEDELGENRVAELAENRVSFRIRISVVCFGVLSRLHPIQTVLHLSAANPR
jgi:hypothetical protein